MLDLKGQYSSGTERYNKEKKSNLCPLCGEGEKKQKEKTQGLETQKRTKKLEDIQLLLPLNKKNN